MSRNTSPSIDSCSVHINFLFWPCLVTRRRRFSASFLTLKLIWLQDQKYSEEFLPDFSQESFHVASLPPAPWSSLLFSHDMFPDMFPCVVSAAARMWRSGELQSWRSEPSEASPELKERLGHQKIFNEENDGRSQETHKSSALFNKLFSNQ